ncbi:MAG: YbfB/YjiJ family MFS transporter [Armatimonadetes bacterium]|nr:YbfB/YjiJ family MFS transporter [Armatimonadota bacterium]
MAIVASNTSLVLLVAWGGAAALAVAMGIGRFAFTPLLPMMQRDGGLSLTEGGWLASANYLGYLIGALSAIWIRAAPTIMVRLGLFLTAALTFAMGLTHELPLWLLMRGAGGVASAWVLVYAAAWALPLLAQWNQPARSGLVFSGVGAGIAVTGLLCHGLAALNAASANVWKLLGGMALLLSLFVWGAVARGGASAPTVHSGAAGFRWTSYMRGLVACYGVFGFGYIIPATFLPVIARRTIHDPHVVDLYWPVFGLAAFLSTLLASSLSGRLDDRRILAGSFALEALGVTAVAFSPTAVGTGLCALLVGGTFMVITMQGLREARRIAGPGVSRFMGLMTAAFAVGQIIGPLYAAYLVRWSGSFQWPLLTAAALMAASVTALFPRNEAAMPGITKEAGS